MGLIHRSTKRVPGWVWRHFRNGSPERDYLNEIGFLSWN